jgi:pimeloyl-ACP methyl ester carboxylesterase
LVTSIALFIAALASACERAPAPPPSHDTSQKSSEAPPPADRPVEVVSVDVPGDVPAFVLHGARGTNAFMVFLHGRCTHALGYVQSFSFAAAKKGAVIAPQGDQACGATPLRRWSLDIEKVNRRIEAALQAAGYVDPAAWKDIVVIGYSEGASRAEALAARYPERYTRAILIGAPATPSVARLHRSRGAVMMAGERDSQEPMKAGMRALKAAGIPSTYIMIPGAAHGQLLDAERIMGEALDWLWANAKPAG